MPEPPFPLETLSPLVPSQNPHTTEVQAFPWLRACHTQVGTNTPLCPPSTPTRVTPASLLPLHRSSVSSISSIVPGPAAGTDASSPAASSPLPRAPRRGAGRCLLCHNLHPAGSRRNINYPALSSAELLVLRNRDGWSLPPRQRRGRGHRGLAADGEVTGNRWRRGHAEPRAGSREMLQISTFPARAGGGTPRSARTRVCCSHGAPRSRLGPAAAGGAMPMGSGPRWASCTGRGGGRCPQHPGDRAVPPGPRGRGPYFVCVLLFWQRRSQVAQLSNNCLCTAAHTARGK